MSNKLPPSDFFSVFIEGGNLTKSLSLDDELLAAYEQFCELLLNDEPVDVDSFLAKHPQIAEPLQELIAQHQFFSRHPFFFESLPECWWPKPGKTFAGFRLIEEMGRGAFARVYKARQLSLGGKLVVVKAAYWGEAEAQLLGRLDHPYITPVYSAPKDEKTGLTLICMPYKGKATLQSVLKKVFPTSESEPDVAQFFQAAEDPNVPSRKRPRNTQKTTYPQEITRVFFQIARALVFLHKKGITHRDLKPSNILIQPDGTPLLLDFNLSSHGKALKSRLGGTLPYMPPEILEIFARELISRVDETESQEKPEAGDSPESSSISFDNGQVKFSVSLPAPPKAEPQIAPEQGRSWDIYSFGLLFYEALTGKHPFGPIPEELPPTQLCQHLLEQQKRGFSSLQSCVPGLNKDLINLIESCLAYDSRQRPKSTREIAEGFRNALPKKKPVSKSLGRRSWFFSFLSLIALTGGLVLYSQTPAPETTPFFQENQQFNRLLGDSSQYFHLGAGKFYFSQGQYEKATHSFAKIKTQGTQKGCVFFWRGVSQLELAFSQQEPQRKTLLRESLQNLKQATQLERRNYIFDC